jgi:tRNA (guanine37-N1)-methyltransferase
MFQGPLGESLLRRAQERGLVAIHVHDLRAYTHDRHRVVDDVPYGGGAGMVLKPEPLFAAVEALAAGPADRRVVLLTPQGRRFTHQVALDLAAREHLILLCGRYEGVDERFVEREVDEEVSIGDYVLSGGELAAAVLIDAIGRLQDGALNDADSAAQDSFEGGVLDCPHYTRSERLGTEGVPAVLLSGDHAAIRRWRRQQSLARTWLRRPDLLGRVQLTKEDSALLAAFQADWHARPKNAENP